MGLVLECSTDWPTVPTRPLVDRRGFKGEETERERKTQEANGRATKGSKTFFCGGGGGGGEGSATDMTLLLSRTRGGKYDVPPYSTRHEGTSSVPRDHG